MVAEGLGVPRDRAQAHTLFEGACNGGVVRACTNLGRLELQHNLGRAVILFQSGCDGGDARGCSELARLSRDGLGTKVDNARAETLFRTACDRGDVEACSELLLLPNVSPAAFASAATQGCSLGNAFACASYGAPSRGVQSASAR